MTKKDYQKLAQVFTSKALIAFPSKGSAKMYYALLNKLIRTLKADNPRFDADKFMRELDK